MLPCVSVPTPVTLVAGSSEAFWSAMVAKVQCFGFTGRVAARRAVVVVLARPKVLEERTAARKSEELDGRFGGAGGLSSSGAGGCAGEEVCVGGSVCLASGVSGGIVD